MAFENVQGQKINATREAVALTKLATGGAVIGYVEGFMPSKQNPDTQNIIMRTEDGAGRFVVWTAGNLKYMIRDGLVKPGILTRITRIADKMVRGKKSSQFTVEQDASALLPTSDITEPVLQFHKEESASGGYSSNNVKTRAAELKLQASLTKNGGR